MRLFVALVVALGGLAACRFDPQTAASSDADPTVRDGGSNGGSDGADAKCPDADNDGVCDAVDKCAGFDDAIDGDGDGVPDGCDTWKCGAAKPADPGNGSLPGRAVIIAPQPSNVANISIAGNGRVVMDTANTQRALAYAYGVQFDCPGSGSCRVQIEYGIPGTRFGCLFDGTVGDNQFNGALNQNINFTTPAQPGVYELRAKVTQVTGGCGSGTTFTGGDPPQSQTFAIVCIPP